MLDLETKCPMVARLAEMALGDTIVLFSRDASRGVALIEQRNGRLGVLRWAGAGEASDPQIADRIRWGRVQQLLPDVEEAERDLDLPLGQEDLISTLLREKLRALDG